VPPEAETLTRLEAVRRIQQQVLANYGKAYEPPPALQETVQGASAWASETQLKVEPVRHTLAALAEDSKVRFTRATLTAQSPTLATAIARLQQQESGARLSQADAVVTQARTVADLDLAKAQAQQIVADARREAEAIRQRGQEEQAALEREQQEREAQLKVEETKTRLTVQSKEEEARKLGLRKKASDPATLAKLAPFITPGYAGIYKPTYDKKPFSFSEMQSLGALAPTVEGLDLVAGIGVARIDTVRPRWKLNPRTYRRYPDQLEMVREAQQLLIELGPVLVEMGKLEP
jgi:F0F1-type ATP synthase membrane subunit b/b'